MTEWLITHGGLWGVIVVALTAVVVYQARRLEALHERLLTQAMEREKAVAEVHEKRLREAQETTDELLKVSDRVHQSIQSLGTAMEAMRDSERATRPQARATPWRTKIPPRE